MSVAIGIALAWWAAPLLAGWVLAAIAWGGRRSVEVDSRDGLLVVRYVGWPVPRRRSAMTVGTVVLTRRALTPELWRHERAHARQWLVLGVGFAVLYGAEYAFRRALGDSHDVAYRSLLLERWARRAEGRE